MTSKEKLNIVVDLINTSLRQRFRKTIAGFIWVILNPIITYLVHCFLLSKILNIQINNIGTFLLGGVLPWAFFTNTIEMSVAQMTNSRNLLQTFNLPPQLLVVSLVLENFILSAISFVTIGIVLYFIEPFPILKLGLVFISALFLLTFTFMISFSLSFLNVFYRDVKFVTSFLLSILFFLTPIFYPENLFPQNYDFIYKYNPIYTMIKPIRLALLEDLTLNTAVTTIFFAPLVTLIATFLLTTVIWKKYRHEFYKRI